MEMLVTPEINFSTTEVLKSYKGKRIFITGHTGFKGSWLSLMLSQAGAVLKGYALAPDSYNALFTHLEPQLGMDSVIADIRDIKRLKEELISFQPEFIFHLAAQSLVRYSYQQPLETFEVNVMGTTNLLEAMRGLTNKCSAVIVTTDKVYENNESGVPFKENDPLGGHDPYSSSKAAAEIVVQSYMKSFFSAESQQSAVGSQQSAEIGIATARAGNVIGGGDRAADRIIPDLVTALETGTTLQVRNPDAIRPWQHVLDPLSGYLKLAMLLHLDPSKYAGSYNFGPYPNDQLSVREIVEMAISTWGSGTFETVNNKHQPHEAGHLRLDITKAVNQLNWKPKWNAKEAVERTVGWYKGEHKKTSSIIESCLRDLDAFMN